MQTGKSEETPAIIYNVTIKVDIAIAEAWLEWMLKEHIPQILDTGCFHSYRVARLLEVDDTDGPTYSIQYGALSKSLYNQYISKYAHELRIRSFEKWGERFIAFRSVMEVVQ